MRRILLPIIFLSSINAFASSAAQNQLVIDCAQPMTAENQAAIENLLKKGADINGQDSETETSPDMGTMTMHNTCLNVAVAKLDPNAVKFILSQHAQVLKSNAKASTGFFSQKITVLDTLQEASPHVTTLSPIDPGAVQIVNLLVGSLVPELHKAGMSIDTPMTNENESLLAVATQYGAAEAANLILNAGANVNAVDKDGDTPLIQAILANSAPVVQMLLQHHASPACSGQLCPIAIAAWYDNADIIEALLQYHADPNSKGAEGEPTLQLACRSSNPNVALIRNLINGGADVNAVYLSKDAQGAVNEEVTALIAAVTGQGPMSAREEIVQYLLQDKKVDPNQGCEYSQTALGLSKIYKADGIAALLIKYGANPNKLSCTP